MWCGDENCEEEIKTKTDGFGSRCLTDESPTNHTCINCGKEAVHEVIWGKSY